MRHAFRLKRRDFLALAGSATALPLAAAVGPATAAGGDSARVPFAPGSTWGGWRKGHFQLHAIHTGAAESMFLIYPDGTTMLLDCGGHAAINRGKFAVPVLPNGRRLAGEWVARYVARVNPNGNDVDYLVVSHFHSDHTGCEGFHAGRTVGRREDYFLSGLAQVAETIRFRKAIDRGWPDYDDPIPLDPSADESSLGNTRKLFRHLVRRDGLKVEKFRVGATDQLAPLRDPATCPGFSARNICGNGRIARADGTVRDLYAARIARERPKELNENGMSLGMLFTYGGFRLYTAGDFSDGWQNPDGSRTDIETELAKALPPVDVAKTNHHGYRALPTPLVAALRPRVWFSCVWDQLHDTADSLARMADRAAYPGERLIAPGVFPAERRWEDLDKPFMKNIAPESFAGGHMVFDVPPGGRDYTLTYLTADDESMRVTGAYRFQSRS